MDKKVLLVTGANGSVGCALLCLLYEKYHIIAVDRSFDNLDKYRRYIECAAVDICNKEMLAPLFEKADYVVHLAAKVHVLPNCEEDAKQFYQVNTLATEDIFELCIERNVEKVIFFSTIAVYGKCVGLISEDAPMNPLTPYAKSKYEAELIGQKMALANRLPLCILRPATIFGNLDRGNYRALIQMARRGLSILPGKGDNFKPIIYVKDAAAIVGSILESDYEPGEVYNICQGNYKYRDILTYIEKAYGLRPFRIRVPKFAIDLLNKLCKIDMVIKLKTLSESIEIDSNKITNDQRFAPQYSFCEGLQDSKAYYLDEGDKFSEKSS